jgi:hypothetical protein
LLLIGCSSSPEVSSDYDPSIDFTAYKSYRWSPHAEGVIPGPLDKRITEDANQILNDKGFELVESEPDLLLRYKTSKKQVFADDGTSYSGSHGYVYDKAQLHLQFIDVAKQEIVWEGKSETMLSTDTQATPEQIKRAVHDVLDNFPPG